MELFSAIPASVIVGGAFALQAAGFLVRDELWLRGLVLGGTLLYMLFYFTAANGPLWDAFTASAILGLINVALIIVILRERTLLTMSAEETRLFQAFSTLTPGQFRRMMKLATQEQAACPLILTQEGAALDHLFYVISGPLRVSKGSIDAPIEEHCFIGEIAFLTDSIASATVTLDTGAVYLRWNADALRTRMRKSPAFHNALLARFNAELAAKLARSSPDHARATINI